jgi:hypothetical protein
VRDGTSKGCGKDGSESERFGKHDGGSNECDFEDCDLLETDYERLMRSSTMDLIHYLYSADHRHSMQSFTRRPGTGVQAAFLI